jgi:hypothetical protein
MMGGTEALNAAKHRRPTGSVLLNTFQEDTVERLPSPGIGFA